MSAFDVVDLIRTKRDGGELTDDEIRWLIDAYTEGSVGDEQMSALTMAILLRGMDRGEIRQWTEAMIASGSRMDFSSISRPTVDKHSTGGIGDKITLPLAPIVAAFRRARLGRTPAVVLALLLVHRPVPPLREPAPIAAEGAGPIVVVGTTGDPATPYQWSQNLAQQLDDAVLLTFEGNGHTAYGRSGGCVEEPVDAYLLEGTVPEDGLTC